LAKPDPQTAKKEQQKKTRRWVITIFLATIVISAAISLASDFVMGKSSMGVAFLILLMIVFIGILFDIVGMAVATADEKPFHAMASRKVRGAKECIMLLRNAERVSSICNDVVGDICGVVSGTASAAISAQILSNFELSFASVVPLALSSLTAALTVGGKAIGKGIAVSACTEIVYHAGQVIYFATHWKDLFKKKNKKKKK
jgi:Mg2+/Co2+ transporter CorB